MNKTVHLHDLGLVDYQEAWDYQESLFRGTVDRKISNRKVDESKRITTQNHLIACQHPHVYTLGKSGNEGHLLLNKDFLHSIGATYYPINRGGDITYHGPGQLVVYPILDLDHFFTDIHKYLRLLEEAVMLCCAHYGLDTGRIEGMTGVWVNHKNPKKGRKICAMGVRSSRWVTMHGLALNVNTDLSYFRHIVPCGIPDKEVTSLANEIGIQVDFHEVQEILLSKMVEVFEIADLEKAISTVK